MKDKRTKAPTALEKTARKKADSLREARIDVRMSNAQREAIERAARRAGLDGSTFMRMATLERIGWNPDAAKDDADLESSS